jgi:hypothetical protein
MYVKCKMNFKDKHFGFGALYSNRDQGIAEEGYDPL